MFLQGFMTYFLLHHHPLLHILANSASISIFFLKLLHSIEGTSEFFFKIHFPIHFHIFLFFLSASLFPFFVSLLLLFSSYSLLPDGRAVSGFPMDPRSLGIDITHMDMYICIYIYIHTFINIHIYIYIC